MDEQELKGLIKVKFKNMQRFCKIAGLTYHKLHNMFRERDSKKRAENIKKIESMYFSLNDERMENEISSNKRALIRTRIYSKYKNITEFCKVAGVSNTVVSNLLSGNTLRETENTRKICSILNISLNERN